MDGFQIGKANHKGGGCCNKPFGCTRRDGGCLFPQHPWKRAMLDGDTSVRCQASSIDGQCILKSGHDGSHDLGRVTDDAEGSK